MKAHHVKRIWSRPLFMKWRKYFCPICGEELKKVRISKIVNSQSKEANDYDFSSAGGEEYIIGNVKFIWTELLCENCNKSYSINDVYQAEKQSRKISR